MSVRASGGGIAFGLGPPCGNPANEMQSTAAAIAVILSLARTVPLSTCQEPCAINDKHGQVYWNHPFPVTAVLKRTRSELEQARLPETARKLHKREMLFAVSGISLYPPGVEGGWGVAKSPSFRSDRSEEYLTFRIAGCRKLSAIGRWAGQQVHAVALTETVVTSTLIMRMLQLAVFESRALKVSALACDERRCPHVEYAPGVFAVQCRSCNGNNGWRNYCLAGSGTSCWVPGLECTRRSPGNTKLGTDRS
jgi:hypothetical protein